MPPQVRQGIFCHSLTGMRDHLAKYIAWQVGQVSISVRSSNAMVRTPGAGPIDVQVGGTLFNGSKQGVPRQMRVPLGRFIVFVACNLADSV